MMNHYGYVSEQLLTGQVFPRRSRIRGRRSTQTPRDPAPTGRERATGASDEAISRR